MQSKNQIQGKPLKFIIEGKSFEIKEEYRTGAELKALAGIPLDSPLFLSIVRPYKDEEIENDTRVNLARPGIEYFYTKKKLKFFINNEPHEWYKQYISLEEIKEIGHIKGDAEVYLRIPQPFDDELITAGNLVDLARPGVEHFYSKDKPFEVGIIVNGREKTWNHKTISFQQVVMLAFNTDDHNMSRAYTVTYTRGLEPKPEGSMIKGSVVNVKDKMIFNVTATDKS
ncbi:MAG: hypothetical protein EOO44_01100 [Flavobacterium sp.]|nr:MAG: hypothetical protein EOO44_01100 [Flavobacterium sp.]